jgi:fructokinase
MTALADVVKVSDEDLIGLLRTNDPDAAFTTLRTWNPQASYLYTKGAAGAALYTPTGAWTQTAPRVDVVDTVGAGDASMAALAWSMLYRPDAGGLSHLRFAVAGGAAACLAAGATPPGLDAIERLLSWM